MNYPVPDLIKKLLCKSVNETKEIYQFSDMRYKNQAGRVCPDGGRIQTGQTDFIWAVFT